MFRTVLVDGKAAEVLESVGTKRKFWFSQGSWLFKDEARGTGEDCAEKIACELAGLGNQLLLARDPNYPGEVQRRYKVKEYTVTAVAECIEHLAVPSAEWTENLPNEINTARGIFVGYIMLDAWVANQDRHHQNWGAIRVPDQAMMFLAPTFDHGASLARNLSDEDEKIA